ncbi:MAG TPA: ATP-binding protein [Blastocatellia bacterium]|nr:ATP-binding protein [Blastocatellia bacterium]
MTPEQFQEFAKLLPEPLLLLSANGRILAVNPPAAELLGVNTQVLEGRALSDFLADPPDKTTRYLRTCSRTSQRIFGSLSVQNANGQVVKMRGEGGAIKSAPGGPVFVLLRLKSTDSVTSKFIELNKKIDQLASEIRRRREAEQEREGLLAREQASRREAEQASRAKDEFLATLSHELRTPLNAVLGWARMLRTSRLDEETTSRALDTIERNAKAQAQLIEDMLDVSRIITGQLRLDVIPINLASVVQAAIEVVRPAADGKDIRLQAVLDPKAGPIAGDPNRLQQVVWNLLSNAIKFTPKRGRIQVRVERINSHVQLTVSDTGQGIKPEFLPYLFERFRQADSTLSRRHGGLGLGLAIVKHIVELHGGTVYADSLGEGQGAEFVIKLPVIIAYDTGRLTNGFLESGGPNAENDPVFECPAALQGLRLMVVEDDADARELVCTILKECGAEAKAVASAAEAFDALREWGPDLIISDIEMPGEDGYSLIRRIRSSSLGKESEVPAVALTAHARVEDRVRALNAGFQSHITKPVDPMELIAVISSLTKKPGRS